MSITAMAEVWRCDLPHELLLVLLALADHADDEGAHIFPSIEQTAWKTGYSYREVLRVQKELISHKILVKDGHHGRAVIYHIDFEQAPHKPPYVKTAKMSDQLGHSHVRSGLQDSSTKVSPNHQEPSDKHHLTPEASQTDIPLPSPTITPIRQLSQKLPPPPKAKVPTPSKNGKEKRKYVRTPKRYDCLWNVIADVFFQGARNGNQRLGRIMNGQDDHGLMGLIDYECDHQNCPEEKLDYSAMSAWVSKFHASLPKDSTGKTIELRDPGKFMERWIGWRETTNRVECPPILDYDPNCPHHCEKGFINEIGNPHECECRILIAERNRPKWAKGRG